jgi:hypothetical protein
MFCRYTIVISFIKVLCWFSGSGKTTLCKAIAQKVFIRNMADYESGFLLEVNSHSLFSKWFSESGKLVMKLFDHINEIADDPQSFVCILIGKFCMNDFVMYV